MKSFLSFSFCSVLLLLGLYASGQTTPPPKQNRYDSATAAHPPKKAALKSALVPGLGQIYNKKIWKVPIVYGALGTSGAIFFYNLNNYQDTRFDYRVKYNMRVNRTDSALFSQIKPNLEETSITRSFFL